MKTVITIGRQFGSGGSEIGEKIAAHFKIVSNYLKKEFNIDIKYSAEIKNVYSYAEYLSDIYKKIEKKFV